MEHRTCRPSYNPELERARDAARRERNRKLVFDHYGRVCMCPGCGATENLTIDHIGGNGREHRIEMHGHYRGGSSKTYAWLVRHNFPEGFQVLCSPCNVSKSNGLACRIRHGFEWEKLCPPFRHLPPAQRELFLTWAANQLAEPWLRQEGFLPQG